MAIQRFDHVGIVVDDLPAAIEFFLELGLEKEGEATLEGDWVDRVVGLDDVQADIAAVRTPDGHGRIELTKFHRPAAIGGEPNAPVNTLGGHRLTFVVDDLDDLLARLAARGAQLVREVAQYENFCRYCYIRGPEGIIIGLVEQLG